MTDLRRQIVAITRPGLAWAVHFIAVYALVSASCAARAMIDYPTLLIAVGAATVVALALCLWSVVLGPRGGDLGRAAFWSGLIFSFATFADTAFLFLVPGCGG